MSVKQYCDALERSKRIPKKRKPRRDAPAALLRDTHEFRETTPREFSELAWRGKSPASYAVYF